MLNIEDIIQLYEEDLEIKLSYTKKEYPLKGEYQSGQIKIYMRRICGAEDLAITLYHELIHAKHDLLNPTSEFHQVMQRGEEISINKYEEDVENEALETFDSYRYSILKLVSEIYTLVIPGCLTHKD